jgi:predicted DCC family thiol-disulfide oxidoreductase YuxK
MCNSFIQFVNKYDKENKIHFSDFHSNIAINLNLSLEDNSIVFYTNGIKYYRSSAFIEILKHIDFSTTFITIIGIIPQSIRDIVYNLIANNRHKIFVFNTKNFCSLDIHAKIIK